MCIIYLFHCVRHSFWCAQHCYLIQILNVEPVTWSPHIWKDE